MEKKLKNIGERYLLEALIKESEVKATFRGHDLLMNRKVAVKVLHNKGGRDESLAPLFLLEAKKAASLDHPNIMEVYDYGHQDDIFFIVMPLIEGMSLRYFLQLRGRLSPERALMITHQVALGLAKAHRLGIIHAAVKPENVLMRHDGAIILTDFGIACVTELLTATESPAEALQYCAPEQMQRELVSEASDVYACGKMLYEMLVGRLPKGDDTAILGTFQPLEDKTEFFDRSKPDIVPALEQIIMRCLERVPEMRFRNGFALVRALEEVGYPEG